VIPLTPARVFRPTSTLAFCLALIVVGQCRLAAANLTWDTTIAANSSISEGAGTWNTGAGNWNNGSTSSGINFANGDNVTIGGGSSGTAGLITLGGTVSPGNITFNTPSSGAYDIGVGSTPAVFMSGGTITANSTQTPKFFARLDGSFTLAGTRTISLTSNGNQTAANTVTINSGATLALGSNSSAGSVGAAAIINNGTLIWRRASAQTISNPVSGAGSVSYQLRATTFTFNSTGTQSYSGSTTIQPTGADAGNSTLLIDISNRLPVTTDLTINANTGSTITLDLNGKDQTLASISAGGSVLDSIITNNGATRSILTLAGVNKIKTYDGLLSGNMDLILNGTGSTLTLDGANTYTGNTTLSSGTLRFGVAGSAANSPAIRVASAGTLDVSTVANFIAGAAQTLSGTGLINGSLTIAGTVSPGASSIGTLNFNGALTLAGTTAIDLQKTGASLTTDFLAGVTTLTYGGTLQINATGDALADGDLINLFDATSFAGAFTTIAPATPGAGLVWDSSALATSGILRVRSASRSTTLYVAPTGSAANPGSEASPMTLQRAAELAQPGDTILLRGGVYRETVTPLASGTSGAPITFQAYGSEEVTVSGADLLPGPWTAGANSIYQSTMPWTLNTPTQGYDQVFIDGEMMMEARFPNTPTLNHTLPVKLVAESASHTVTAATVSTDISTGTFFHTQLTQPAGYWVGASITATLGKIWVAETSTVTASGPGWVSFTFPTPSDKDLSNYLPTAGNPFFLFGKSGDLDSGGEWFRDASSQTLSLRTPLSTSPVGLTVEAKRRKLAFNLDGRSWIQVKGIKLFAATITTDATSSQCTFDDLQVRYPAHFTKLARWATGVTDADAGIILRGSGHVLKNSIISDCAGSAVAVIGSDFEVTNNYIHDVNYSGGNGAGVNSGNGYSSATGSHRHSTSNTKITYNTITRSGQRCIDFTGMTGSEIMYNDVSQSGIQVTDVAPLYSVGTNAQSTDGTFQGPSNGPKTRVAYNFVHDSDGALSGLSGISHNNVKGIYLDNGSRNFVVDHNVVLGVHSGIVLNIDSSKPSSDNIILNNTVFGNDRSMGWNTNPMTGTIIQNNIFRKGTSTGPNASLITNIASGTSPLLTDEANGDYTLQAASPAINSGTAMSPYTDGSVGRPDRGAFEYGLPAWRAGSDRVGLQAWKRVSSGGLWDHVANWENGLVPFGAESSADFSHLDITTDNTVLLNAPRTVNQLAFGDLTPASAGSWILSNQGTPANILTLDGLSPIIRVGALGTGKSATISASIGGVNGWTKTGAGTLILSGVNSYTGPTVLGDGTLSFNSLADTGLPSALGAGDSIQVTGNNKSLTYTGATVSSNRSLITSSNKLLLFNSGGGLLTLSGLVNTSSGGNLQLRAGNLTLSGVISGSGLVSVNSAASTLTLTNAANTFSEALDAFAGKISVSSLSNAGVPSAAGTAATINIGGNTGSLIYTGTGSTHNRIISMTGTTGGATLDHSGTGLLKFTADFAIPGAGNKTLTLQGSTAGTGEISGAIRDNSGANQTSLTKAGSSVWTLSGLNTYTGATQITAGTLICASPSALGTGALSIGAGGGATLQLTYAGTRQIASLSLGGGAPLPNGSYGSSASPARFKHDAYFSGTGTVTVGPPNTAPVAIAQTLTTRKNTARTITLAGSDADNHPLVFSVLNQPANGTLSGLSPNLIYTPNANYEGPESFSFKVNDGEADSAPATVAITVTPVNDAPVAQAQAVTTAEDTLKSIPLAGSDLEGDALTYTVVTPPVRGTLGGTPPNFTYTPQENYHGADSFTFRVNDGIADSAPALVEIMITPVNDAPVAADQSVETPEGVAKDVFLTATDIDLDVLSFAIVTSPASGSLSGTPPNLTYTPAPGFQGTDSFSFKANDGAADSPPATVTVTVRAVTFIYTNSTSNTAPGTPWADGTQWNAIPVGGPATKLTFGNGTLLAASQTIFANNNIAGNFTLNRIDLTYAGPASGTAPALTLGGNALELVNNGLLPPTLLFQTTGSVKPSVTLNHNLIVTHDATITTTTDVLLGGVFSGSGGFTKTGSGILRYQGNSPAYAGNIGVSAGTLQVGNNGGSGNLGTGTITLSGSGGFSVRRQGNLTLSNTLTGGSSGTVSFQLNGSAVVTLAKAASYSNPTNLGPTGANAIGTLKLGIANGLPANTPFTITNSGASVQTFDLNGFDQTLFSLATGANGNSTNTLVTNSGALKTLTISGSATTSYAGALSGALDLSKSGSGGQSFTGNLTYTGYTTVAAGTLTLQSANPNNQSSFVSLAATGATLSLNFTGTDTVEMLFIGGVQQAAGVYEAIGNAGAGTEIPQLTGTGTLTVTSGPPAAAYDTWAADKGLTAANMAMGLDPDGDGQTNLAEFAFNGDPLGGANSGLRAALEDTDGDTLAELTLTLAVRNGSGSPVFSTASAPAANVDGITYTIEGSLDLVFPTSPVSETAPPTGLPALPEGWEYRRFRLDAFEGSAIPRGFLRVRVNTP